MTMPFKDIFKRSFWDAPKLVLVFSILLLIASTTLQLRETAYNPDIHLDSTFLPQQTLFNIENSNHSIDSDNIEKLDTTNLNCTKKYILLKLIENDESNLDRKLLVLLSDPNNIVRFSSVNINGSNTLQNNISSLRLHKILVNKYIKVNIPDLSNMHIYGIWHLNIYVFNQENELTFVASIPVDSLNLNSNTSSSNSNVVSFSSFIPIVQFVASLSSIFSCVIACMNYRANNRKKK